MQNKVNTSVCNHVRYSWTIDWEENKFNACLRCKMNFNVIRVHCSSENYFYMLPYSLSLFNIDFYCKPCRYVSLWPLDFFSASVCGQRLYQFVANFNFLALQKRGFFFHEFFTVPKNRKFSKSFEINNNAKKIQNNWDMTTNT